MPHYKDGTIAQVGDLVHGRGYNIKHDIQGIVTHITPNAEQCNIQVTHPVAALRPAIDANGDTHVEFSHINLHTEYGETRAFEKITGLTGRAHVPVPPPTEAEAEAHRLATHPADGSDRTCNGEPIH